MQVVGIDCVDDESKPEHKFMKRFGYRAFELFGFILKTKRINNEFMICDLRKLSARVDDAHQSALYLLVRYFVLF
jgi:hypothetical protein